MVLWMITRLATSHNLGKKRKAKRKPGSESPSPNLTFPRSIIPCKVPYGRGTQNHENKQFCSITYMYTLKLILQEIQENLKLIVSGTIIFGHW
jgi:hypothetical protein